MIRFRPGLSLYARCFLIAWGVLAIGFAFAIFQQGEFGYNRRYDSDIIIRRSESPVRFWMAICVCAGAGVAAISHTILPPSFWRIRSFWIPGNRTRRARPHPVFYLVLGILFLLPGLKFTKELSQQLHRAWKLKNAVEVPAEILDLDLRPSRRRGRELHGSALYKYSYEGKTYVSDRIALFAYGNTLKELKSAANRGEPVSCFVDPEDPSLSVLNKEVSLGTVLLVTLFAGTFTTIGAGIVWSGIHSAWSLRHPPVRAPPATNRRTC